MTDESILRRARRLRRKPGRIGLALGGGAARGWAHIGVIEALAERGIRIDCIAGTSMGALVGAFHASGRLSELREIACGLDWRRALHYFLEMTFPRSGMIDGRKIADFARKSIAFSRIEDMPVPFKAVASDVKTGEEIILDRGDAINAVRASISIPGMFTPVPLDDHLLVDGGLVNPVPVSVVRAMGADTVIAVDVNQCIFRNNEPGRPATAADSGPGPESSARPAERAGLATHRFLDRMRERLKARAQQQGRSAALPNIFDILGSSIQIMQVQITESRFKSEPPDVLIRPDVGNIGFMDFHRAREAISAGHAAATSAVKP